MIQIKPLASDHTDLMYKCFLEAFSDYSMHFQLDYDAFKRKFIQKLNLHYPFSCGAFNKDQLIGFIFTSTGIYKGKTTAYNGGTGVVPAFRGQSITRQMYQFLQKEFELHNIHQMALEVITHNESAIKAYEKCGFTKKKLLKCYKLSGTRIRANDIDDQLPLHFAVAAKPDWEQYIRFWDIEPTYLDHIDNLSKNVSNEVILEAYVLDKLAGYAIFQKEVGRISQFAISKEYRKKGIGTLLLNEVVEKSFIKSISVLNVAGNHKNTNTFLLNRGFENQVDQFEMIKSL